MAAPDPGHGAVACVLHASTRPPSQRRTTAPRLPALCSPSAPSNGSTCAAPKDDVWSCCCCCGWCCRSSAYSCFQRASSSRASASSRSDDGPTSMRSERCAMQVLLHHGYVHNARKRGSCAVPRVSTYDCCVAATLQCCVILLQAEFSRQVHTCLQFPAKNTTRSVHRAHKGCRTSGYQKDELKALFNLMQHQLST